MIQCLNAVVLPEDQMVAHSSSSRYKPIVLTSLPIFFFEEGTVILHVYYISNVLQNPLLMVQSYLTTQYQSPCDKIQVLQSQGTQLAPGLSDSLS